jgi:hypothetical protein
MIYGNDAGKSKLADEKEDHEEQKAKQITHAN